jgi:hypothetical protein
MNFRDFLREAKEVHHTFTFMRANPVTTGHQLVVNKVKEVSKQHILKIKIKTLYQQNKNSNTLKDSSLIRIFLRQAKKNPPFYNMQLSYTKKV